jgi:kynureninase
MRRNLARRVRRQIDSSQFSVRQGGLVFKTGVADSAPAPHQRRMAAITLADVRASDKQDPLRDFRTQFALPEGVIYLDGNSLGPLPHATQHHLAKIVAQQWGTGLIRSWTDAGWLDAPARIGAKIAPLIGAAPDEVIAADSTSVNLFKLLSAALSLRPGRTKILTESDNFPTDRHVAEGLAALVPGLHIQAVPAADLPAALDTTTAALLLCHVHYRSGARHDMAALTHAAHQAGALSIWDLSHSAGAIPVALNACHADMAVGCGYKFLNGGPGAPAFLYVARHLQPNARPALQGWIGHADPFGFSDRYAPAGSINRFLTGTPGILALSALESAIDLFATASQPALWQKSAQLFDLFATRAASLCPELALITPTTQEHRGSHISFRHQNAAAIMKTLIAQGIIGDYRPPDLLRFGLTPLYTTQDDIWHATAALRAALESRRDMSI